MTTAPDDYYCCQDDCNGQMLANDPRFNEAMCRAIARKNDHTAVAARAAWVDRLFTYHPPTAADQARYKAINKAARDLAMVVLAQCPPGEDTNAVLRAIAAVRMQANAAIATRVRTPGGF